MLLLLRVRSSAAQTPFLFGNTLTCHATIYVSLNGRVNNTVIPQSLFIFRGREEREADVVLGGGDRTRVTLELTWSQPQPGLYSFQRLVSRTLPIQISASQNAPNLFLVSMRKSGSNLREGGRKIEGGP